MSEIEEKKVEKSVGIRMTQEDNEKFKAFCDSLKVKQGEGFSALIKIMELYQAKEAIPEAKADIDLFDSLVDQISTCFLHSISLYRDAEKKADEKYIDLIHEKDKKIDTLKADVEKLEGFRKEAEKARAEAEDARKYADQLKQSNVLLLDKCKEYDAMKAREKQLADELASAKEQISKHEISLERAVMEKEREMNAKLIDLITENAELKAQLK